MPWLIPKKSQPEPVGTAATVVLNGEIFSSANSTASIRILPLAETDVFEGVFMQRLIAADRGCEWNRQCAYLAQTRFLSELGCDGENGDDDDRRCSRVGKPHG